MVRVRGRPTHFQSFTGREGNGCNASGGSQADHSPPGTQLSQVEHHVPADVEILHGADSRKSCGHRFHRVGSSELLFGGFTQGCQGSPITLKEQVSNRVPVWIDGSIGVVDACGIFREHIRELLRDLRRRLTELFEDAWSVEAQVPENERRVIRHDGLPSRSCKSSELVGGNVFQEAFSITQRQFQRVCDNVASGAGHDKALFTMDSDG